MSAIVKSWREVLVVTGAAFIGGIAGASVMLVISLRRQQPRLQIGQRKKTSKTVGRAQSLLGRLLQYPKDADHTASGVAIADQQQQQQQGQDNVNDPYNPSKREEYLSWDDYFMAVAFLSAQRSKDPNRQVGACLVSQSGVILGIGYNGFPRGCSDDELPWAKRSSTGDPLLTKYLYVCHAEVNAILNTNHASAVGQRLFVTMFPCNECAKVIIQAGVVEVIYFIDKNNNSSDPKYVAARRLLSLAGVKVSKHQPMKPCIVIDFK